MSAKTTVFYTNLSSYHTDLIQYLPKAERQRVIQFSSNARKQLFILGRALLAEALFRLARCGEYTIIYQIHGKPMLHATDNWQFNITHSGEHLFLALRQNCSIGIDSEILRLRQYKRLAEKLFTSTEQDEIANAQDPMQVFYRLWTRYEAQIKCLGLSVFSELPKKPRRFLTSYRYQSLLFSLCSDSPIEIIDSYRYTPSEKTSFENIALTQIN